MRVSKIALKVVISALLSVAVATVFPLSSVAAARADKIQTPSETATAPASQDLTGTLVVSKGNVSINGNSSQVGATVLSASRIVTGSDGVAVIDLGPQGRVEIRDDSTVIVTFAPGMVHIKSECDRTRIEVTRGQVDVKVPEIEAIPAGEDETYDGSVEATTNGSTDFIVDCGEKRAAFIWAGWWGVAGLLAVGTLITVGIVVGDNDSGPRRVSPVI